jgi:hypothetical protein
MKRFILVLIFLGLTSGFCDVTSSAKEEIRVQVKFSEDTVYGTFNDALYFTQDEFKVLSQKDLDLLKKAKLDAWIYEKEHPAPVIPPDPKDLIRARIQEQINDLSYQQVELEVKLQTIVSKKEKLEAQLN